MDSPDRSRGFSQWKAKKKADWESNRQKRLGQRQEILIKAASAGEEAAREKVKAKEGTLPNSCKSQGFSAQLEASLRPKPLRAPPFWSDEGHPPTMSADLGTQQLLLGSQTGSHSVNNGSASQLPVPQIPTALAWQLSCSGSAQSSTHADIRPPIHPYQAQASVQNSSQCPPQWYQPQSAPESQDHSHYYQNTQSPEWQPPLHTAASNVFQPQHQSQTPSGSSEHPNAGPINSHPLNHSLLPAEHQQSLSFPQVQPGLHSSYSQGGFGCSHPSVQSPCAQNTYQPGEYGATAQTPWSQQTTTSQAGLRPPSGGAWPTHHGQPAVSPPWSTHSQGGQLQPQSFTSAHHGSLGPHGPSSRSDAYRASPAHAGPAH